MNNTLKIIHFSTATGWRGGEQQIAGLCRELSRNKQISQFVSCPEGSPLEQYCLEQNIPVRTFVRRKGIFRFLLALDFAKICREIAPDLAHLHDSHAHTYGVLSRYFHTLRFPMIAMRRVDFPVSTQPFSVFKYNHPSIHSLVCVSEAARKTLSPIIRDKNKLCVLHSSIEISRFVYTKNNKLRILIGAEENTKITAYCTALSEDKGIRCFIETAARIREKGIKMVFVLIGADAGFEQAAKQLVAEKQLTDFVFFTGFRKDIPELLPGADFLLFTSEKEGLGSSILEAFACRVPVLASNTGGIPEIVRDGETGLLAPVNDANIFAEKLQYLYEHPDDTKQLSENAWKLCTEHFSMSSLAARTLGLYQEALSARK